MKPILPDYAQSGVLIIGDVMLDRYWYGPTGRISPEAPVPVVKIENNEERPGGAANVAMNIAALGGNAKLVGLTGQDEPAQVLNQSYRHSMSLVILLPCRIYRRLLSYE